MENQMKDMAYGPAAMEDLPELKRVCRKAVRHMQQNRMQIWDDYYPCECFEADIRNRRLYLLKRQAETVAAFALCAGDAGEACVKWQKPGSRALYLDRFLVSVDWQGKGVGRRMLEAAKESARASGAEYLRLFVADTNLPAIRLYSRNGFTRAEGMYGLVIDGGRILHEYGYETRVAVRTGAGSCNGADGN